LRASVLASELSRITASTDNPRDTSDPTAACGYKDKTVSEIMNIYNSGKQRNKVPTPSFRKAEK